MESLDSYYAFVDGEGELLAGAGLAGSVLKCLAVSESHRSSGMLVPLVSRIMSEHPGPLKVFTKPEYQAVFESMGFRLLASAPLAVLLENGRGLEQYCSYLRSFRREGRTGVVVMNANPFTLGHQYLLQQASSQVDHLFVIPVKEDCSDFLYEERLAMIRAAVADLCHSERSEESMCYEGPTAEGNYFSGRCPKNQFPSAIATPTRCHSERSEESNRITVLEGSEYVISAVTFPTYFLKDLSTAAQTQMQLDVDLYTRWIAPALGASVRFVGSEPLDALTNRYNQLITNSVVVPRMELDGAPVSASRVRSALSLGRFGEASALCPVSSRPYLLAALAQRALLLELDTPLKPGLVCPESSGAHSDMNYSVMAAGIRALRPFWSQMALAPDAPSLIALGIEAEKAMLAATGGVNTHRGAIFCLGIALNAAMRSFPDNGRFSQSANYQRDMQIALCNIAGSILCNQLNVNNLTKTPLTGARAIAATGYRQLFEDWLPYYRSGAGALRTLLKIMSTLDDTCVVHRVGKERAERVKEEILRFAQNDNEGNQNDNEGNQKDRLQSLCEEFAAERISPGGAADMLALTIFIHSILS